MLSIKCILIKPILLCLSICLSVGLCMGNGVAVAGVKPESSRAVSLKGALPKSLDWYNEGRRLIRNNNNIAIYDINTGITWNAQYINGSNHADVIPLSAADARKIASHKIVGNSARRPVIATIAGVNYAGSMYAVAHGKTNYCSYFNGVMCLHFTGSKTHGTQKIDNAHQKAIKTALRAKIE